MPSDAFSPSDRINHKPKAKPKKAYAVYLDNGKYVGSTIAVSKAQAVNNVRHNTKGDYLGNNGYYAIEIQGG